MEEFTPYGSEERFAPNLRGWSVQAAVRLSVAMSGKAEEEIAAAMGWSKSASSRFFHNLDYWPSLPTIPRYCQVVGNTILARWIAQNADIAVASYAPMDAATLVDDLRKLMREVSRIMEEGQAALKDWEVEPHESRRILRRVEDLLAACCAMVGRLQASINQGKGEL